MFVCKACLRKGLSTVASESRLLLRPVQSQAATALSSRRLASSSATVVPKLPLAPADETADLAEQRRTEKLKYAVKKHLTCLKDPLKIGEHVQRTLEKGNFEEALLLVRTASRDTKLTVSWNHLIDYEMKKQHLHAAIKLYNEMKKRAQLPDSRTFTIIFRGCAQSDHPRLAVSEAVRIYNTMVANGRVSPSTIHLNAVLEVCARAGDLDSMFTILQTANNGTRKPDGRTYTIVLNALRHKPDHANRLELDEVATQAEIDLSISRAKIIWEDVMARWNSGQILIDEALVCAMGRLLAKGDHKDKKSILDLLETTLKVPRFDLTGESSTTGQSQTQLKPSKANNHSLTVPTPGNNTLSLVMQHLAVTKKTSLAPRYWHHFTTVYGVEPDKDNYISYIKVLMKGRASTKTAEAILSMDDDMLQPLIYRFGFSTCIHDELNRHAFANACLIFDLMIAKSRHPDPLAMRLFLQSARGNVRYIYEQNKDDPRAGRLAVGKQICTALERMWQPFRMLMNSFNFSGKPQRKNSLWGLSENERDEAASTARRMIAAMDVVVNEELVEDPELLKTLKARRVLLNKLVERYVETLEIPEPKGKRITKKDGRTDSIFPLVL
ncbi:hypothetical protein B0T16DRAFT_412658 [Cercophora newfieldiana]|uniref:Pentatricopeptide repeat protein n=1 Tax=Cercophora newfieldiana TaxID=92897 RepID=A0AA39Y7V7_9PEZI|nr:hypothetical protein B0T16DRAFT_412658 [Cercophora newfieldiana]